MNERDVSVEEACGLIRENLDEAVRLRLRADVPLYVELSGGMDSSVLVAAAAQQTTDRISTFTVRFEHEHANEEPFARSVARRFGTDYHVIESPVDNFWRQISPFTYLEEQPYHSPNLHVNQVIWSIMRSEGRRVSLNGAAGDELFAGYNKYFYGAQYENLRRCRLKRFSANTRGWGEGLQSANGGKGSVAGFFFDIARKVTARSARAQRWEAHRDRTFHQPFRAFHLDEDDLQRHDGITHSLLAQVGRYRIHGGPLRGKSAVSRPQDGRARLQAPCYISH
jgi:asparagine synthetase B (glutamine-hydrolysing)